MEPNIDRLYEILDIPKNATIPEIKKAYRQMTFIWHPDRIPANNLELKEKANEQLKRINHAYSQIISIAEADSTLSISNSIDKPQKPTKHTTPENRKHYKFDRFEVNFKKFNRYKLLKKRLFNSIVGVTLLEIGIVATLYSIRFIGFFSGLWLSILITISCLASVIFGIGLIIKDFKYTARFCSCVFYTDSALSIDHQGIFWNYYSEDPYIFTKLKPCKPKKVLWSDFKLIEYSNEYFTIILHGEITPWKTYASYNNIKILTATVSEIASAIEYYSNGKFPARNKQNS